MRACLPAHVCVLVCVLALALAACSEQPPPPKRMQTVKLLAEAPPPPPPKPAEKKPEPPKEDKARPQPQVEQPRPAEAQPQALRSDEAAGDGPGNGMVSGPVTRDYTDQKIGDGNAGGSASAVSLVAATSYANALTRSLHEFLSRERDLRRTDYRARVLVWLTPRGSVQRVEILEGTGDVQTDDVLRAAIARFPGSATAPPERLPQPLRLQVVSRLLG